MITPTQVTNTNNTFATSIIGGLFAKKLDTNNIIVSAAVKNRTNGSATVIPVGMSTVPSMLTNRNNILVTCKKEDKYAHKNVNPSPK